MEAEVGQQVKRGRADHPAVVEALLDNGASINAQNSKGQTALAVGAATLGIDSIKVLLRRGADVNLANARGEAPLHSACVHGSVDSVLTLFELAPDLKPELVSAYGYTPIELAAETEGGVNVL